LIVIILAVVVGGGILGYQYWWLPKEETKILETKPLGVKAAEVPPEGTAEDETLNWKTYRNEEYGFEIKHPEDWTIEEFSKGKISFLLPPLEEFPNIQDIVIHVKILENPEELSTHQWLTNKINDGIIIPLGEISDFTTDNIKGIKLIEVERIPIPVKDLTDAERIPEIDATREVCFMRLEHESAYVCRNNLVYNLAVATSEPFSQPPYLYFDKVLSTFRFLE